MQLALLAVSSGLLLATGLALALAVPLRSILLRVVAAFVLTQAALTAVLLFCGVVLGRLDGGTIVAVAALQAGVALVVARRAGVAPARIRDTGDELLRAARHLRHPLVLLPLLLVAGSVAWRAFLAWRLPILDFDGFSYHLVTVDVWLQSDAIGRVPQRIWSDGYPANGELVTLWLMAFTRSDLLADLTGVLPIPMLVVAVAALARQLGTPPRAAALGGLVVGMMPAVIALGPSTYVDTWAAADLAAGWSFGLAAFRARGRERTTLLVLTGVGLGLGVGVKAPLAWSAVILSAALTLQVLLADGALAARARAALGTAATLAVAGLLFGGYWYLKNLVVFGNPLWPFEVGPFDGLFTFEFITQTPDALLPVPEPLRIPASWLADVTRNRYLFDTRVGGFGVAWPLLLALGLGGAWLTLRSPRRWPVAALLASVIVTLATIPMGYWPRYTLFVPILGVALASVALARLPRRPNLLATGAVLALAVWSLGVASARANLITHPGRAPAWFPELATLAMTSEPSRTDLGLWLQCAPLPDLPPGSVVAADSFGMLHAAVGPNLERRLAPVVEPGSDAAAWHGRLRAAGATHVAIGLGSPILPGVEARPNLFRPLGETCREAFVFALAPA